jgi:hypothetical protein
MQVRAMDKPRQLTCERCGASFSCNLAGKCWCGEVSVRLPLPKPGESRYADCLCSRCLHELASGADAVL